MDEIVGKTYQTYNSLPPCQEIDISCHKLSQNDHFVIKYPSSVAAILKLRFQDHVTPNFQLTLISAAGPQPRNRFSKSDIRALPVSNPSGAPIM